MRYKLVTIPNVLDVIFNKVNEENSFLLILHVNFTVVFLDGQQFSMTMLCEQTSTPLPPVLINFN